MNTSVEPISVSVLADIGHFCRYRYRPIYRYFCRYRYRPIYQYFWPIPCSSHTISATLFLLLSLVEKQLAKLVCHYLTPTCASIDVERLFSTNGDVVTPERNNLLPENARKILYLCENMSFLRFNYWKLQNFANKPCIYAIHENIGIGKNISALLPIYR